MVAERTTDRQREYYDNFFSDVDIGLSPVERLKQEGRLGALAGLSGGRAFSRAAANYKDGTYLERSSDDQERTGNANWN